VIATHAVDRNFDCHCFSKRQNRDSRNPRWNMTVCKTKLQPMKKEKAMLHKSAPPVSGPAKASITRRFWFSGLCDHGKSR
jgi:hypothetical protein